MYECEYRNRFVNFHNAIVLNSCYYMIIVPRVFKFNTGCLACYLVRLHSLYQIKSSLKVVMFPFIYGKCWKGIFNYAICCLIKLNSIMLHNIRNQLILYKTEQKN